METQLTLFDYQEMPLKSLEYIIEKGLSTFIEVGMALMAIKTKWIVFKKEAGYTDFESYVEDRWGMAKSRGWQLLNAGTIGNEISTMVEKKPKHERQVRPLSRLGTWKEPKPELWVEAWQGACDLAGDNPPTEKEVKYVVDQMLWQEPPPIPTGEYRVIYADPPWQFDNSGFDQSAAAHYPTMPTEKIIALEVPAAPNAVCFMWATNAMLQDALDVMEGWGFDYKTNLVWVKETGPTIGFYVVSRHELLLIGTKGEHMLPEVKPISIIKGDVTIHSRKPANVYDLIESMYDGPYIELFARVQREGWDIWGNENVK